MRQRDWREGDRGRERERESKRAREKEREKVSVKEGEIASKRERRRKRVAGGEKSRNGRGERKGLHRPSHTELFSTHTHTQVPLIKLPQIQCSPVVFITSVIFIISPSYLSSLCVSVCV